MARPSTIQALRQIGKIEGISFLLLMGIAMPLKYLVGYPLAVTVVGWAHGVLFVIFCGVLAKAWWTTPLTFGWACLSFVAALLPFGPFVIDGHLRQFEVAPKPSQNSDSK